MIGEIDGVRLLPDERIRIATTLQTDEYDTVIERTYRKALGYHIGGLPLSPLSLRPSVFGHPGAGGSIGFADPDSGLTFAIVKTKLVWEVPPEGEAAFQIARELRATLGVPESD